MPERVLLKCRALGFKLGTGLQLACLHRPQSLAPCLLQAAQAAGSAPSVFRVQQIAACLVGFLCYKAAVVGVAIIPPPVDEAGAALAPDGTPRRADTPRD